MDGLPLASAQMRPANDFHAFSLLQQIQLSFNQEDRVTPPGSVPSKRTASRCTPRSSGCSCKKVRAHADSSSNDGKCGAGHCGWHRSTLCFAKYRTSNPKIVRISRRTITLTVENSYKTEPLRTEMKDKLRD